MLDDLAALERSGFVGDGTSEKLDQTISEVGGICNLLSKSESMEDISDQYFDSEALGTGTGPSSISPISPISSISSIATDIAVSCAACSRFPLLLRKREAT